MSEYPLNWITSHLAVGHAPMSYDELDSLKRQGIDAMVNLCGEFCDLHEIEEGAGFEVFWLPVPDETAPKMEDMENGLAWLDEQIYLGKKVLVHCRHGMGRTGTFVTAYLLRRGFSLKKAGKLLKATRANPTNFSQWWLLRKYGKKEGQLTVSEPTPENRKNDDLNIFFTRYEALLAEVDRLQPVSAACCGREDGHCADELRLEIIEALYLHEKVNVTLKAEQRKQLIDSTVGENGSNGEGVQQILPVLGAGRNCPLHHEGACLMHRFRPVSCRLHGNSIAPETLQRIREELDTLSREVFAAVFGFKDSSLPPPVKLADVVSGRFIQRYFQYLATRKS